MSETRTKETRSNQPITLGELIDQLAARPEGQTVRFDFPGVAPVGVDSFRGYYDHLAIEYAENRCTTVGNLLAQLREALGAVFEGYKGGDFRMTRDTPMWVANYGESGSTAVLGIHDECEYETIIATGYCHDWEGGMARARQVLFGSLGFGNTR